MTEDKSDDQTEAQAADAPAPGNGATADPPAADPPAEAAPPSPEARIAQLETEKEETRNRMLRIAADFDNWKKRTRKEQSDAEMRARENVLRDMLEIVDNLERAVAAAGDASDAASVRKGIDLVLRLFVGRLERHDVKSFEAVGQSFDPRIHEAISQQETADVPAGNVVAQMQKGYKLGERLLRPAMVTVAVAPKAAEVSVEVEGDAAADPAGSAAESAPAAGGEGEGS